ncbi:autorepressor SdpR family transcription factor [Bifidobacterium merycicum]|uniref:autorepressor SdpR family transcription factor n=1 Tax=Bifidobacterium merycicum TaxID=78345 RepID=UPI000D19D64D|nr:autorepressor SdpR family transcription factor [Bifidobacterium merycicum]MEE1295200.1 autorepressor SdpR family transcription factor [Bifidobacterium merycicum]
MAGEGFKALADPTRRRILELLRDGDMTAGELAEHFNMSKPSISHHLATLKAAGLVLDERHGQNIIYSLNTTVMQDLIGWFMGFLGGDDTGTGTNTNTGADIDSGTKDNNNTNGNKHGTAPVERRDDKENGHEQRQ